MAIYELEDRVYFDGAAIVDVVDVSEAMEEVFDADSFDDEAESNVDFNNVEEYGFDSTQDPATAGSSIDEVTAAIEELDTIDLAEYNLDANDESAGSDDNIKNLIEGITMSGISDDIAETQQSIDQTVDIVDIQSSELDAQSSPNVLLISSAVKDADVLADAANEDTIVIQYDHDISLDDLADQIREELGETTVDSIGLVSHSSGVNQFAITDSEIVNIESTVNDAEQTEFWSDLQSSLNDGGRIDILACNVASGEQGQDLIDSLETVTSINFAASNNITGNDYGGDWILETDDINVQELYFESELIENYSYVLTAPTIAGGNSDFENGLTGWTVNGTANCQDSVTLTTSGNTWIHDSTGSGMAVLLPWGANTEFNNDIQTTLGITTESKNYISDTFYSNSNKRPTNFASITSTFDAVAGDSFNVSWNYTSTDYIPWNDGSLLSVVNVNTPSQVAILDGVQAEILILGATNPGTGNYTTGSYGSTGWQTSSVTIQTGGTYTLGFSVFNLGDTVLNPYLFVDSVAGTTTLNGTPFGPVAPDESAPAPAGNTSPIASDATASVDEDSSVAIALSATDADGDALTYAVDNPSHGTVSLSGTTATYTPTADYTGSDSFTYTVSDGAATDTATVTVTVNNVNEAPVASNAAASVDEDSSVAIALSATDADGDALTYAVDNPSHGTVSLSGTTATYTPTADYTGSDSFTYTVSDGAATDTATVTVTVNNVNEAPVASNAAASVDEDSSVAIALSATDADGDALTYAVDNPSHGTVSLSGTTATYTPTADYTGSDSFTYTVSDGAATDTATVTVTVNNVNEAPVASNAAASVDEDSSVAIALSATDADGDALTYAVDNPSHGTVSLSGTTATYTPTADYTGSDSFTYTVSDGAATDTATVTVTVNNVNEAPVASNAAASVDEDSSVAIALSATDADGDALTYAVDNPSHGTVSLSGTTATYTPTADYTGSDSFTYTVSDGAATDTATVTVTVNNVNEAPVASNAAASVDEDSSVAIALSATDADGDALTYAVDNPSHGTVSLSGTTATYTPTADYTGSDSFTYTVSDGAATDTATVTVTVNNVNEAPVASNAAASVDEDSSVAIALSATDADGDALTYAVDNPSHGTVSLSGTTATYTPTADYTGSDSFTYTVSDGAATDTATVTVTVNNVNEAPVASNAAASVDEDSSVAIALSATDADGDALTYAVDNPSHGTVSLSGTTATYTPTADYTGSDSFTYTVSDGAATDTATVTVTVAAVDDVVINDSTIPKPRHRTFDDVKYFNSKTNIVSGNSHSPFGLNADTKNTLPANSVRFTDTNNAHSLMVDGEYSVNPNSNQSININIHGHNPSTSHNSSMADGEYSLGGKLEENDVTTVDNFDYSEMYSNIATYSSKHPLFKTDLDKIIEEFIIG